MAEDRRWFSGLRRPDQPVEGCEIMPTFRSNGAIRRSPISTRWYRCLDNGVHVVEDVVPNALPTGRTLQHVLCRCAGSHPAQHSTGLAQCGPRHEAQRIGAPLTGRKNTLPSRSGSNANTMSYTPAQEDIGHTLKLVRAKWRR